MKLSEAINLGAMSLEHMKPCEIEHCALGAACSAAGIKKSYFVVGETWPWVKEGRFTNYGDEFQCNGETAITSRFDTGVMQEKTMTLEQLIDYVGSIEPSCGECNCFECTCSPAVPEAKETAEVCR